MRAIIICLLCILAFSGYMAVTTDNRFKPEAVAQPNVTPPVIQQPDANFYLRESEKQLQEIYNLLAPVKEPVSEPAEDESEDEGGEEEYVSDSSIESEIADVFGEEHKIALAVAKAESGLNPSAINTNRDGSRDIGIFQINDKHGWSESERLDWLKNIRIAKELKDRRGWGEWVAYNNGTYQRFL